MDANTLGMLLIVASVILLGTRWYCQLRNLTAQARIATILLLIEFAVVVGVFLSAFLEGWTGGIGP